MDKYNRGCGVFGFWKLFGSSCSGFGQRRGKPCCSVCSVDFVEKLWESLWVKRWKGCGKVSTFLANGWFSTKKAVSLHIIRKLEESFPNGFTQRFSPVKWGFCTVSTDPTTITTNILERKRNGD